jgi:UDPglucose 6-dehydrogenase
MKITVIGTGYVGLVSGACLSKLGINTTCVDIDEEKILNLKNGIIPIYEPGLEDFLKDNKNISFSTNLEESMKDAEIIMIAVGTPENKGCPHGSSDLQYIYKAAQNIAAHLTTYQVVVTKSTVSVGTNLRIKEIIQNLRPDLKEGVDFDVASNPEFLREGSAISDFMNPDRVVIGTDCKKAKKTLLELYKPLKKKGYTIFHTDITSAELIKYAANGFLATKIAFINQISDLCEKAGADIHDVSFGIGLDKRINPHFLNPGPGYGGSCFPKDTKALAQTAEIYGSDLGIIDAVIKANRDRKSILANRLITYFKNHPHQKKIAILGITFKANTDDLREAASLTIIPELMKAGLEVIIFDPLYFKGSGREDKISVFKNVRWAATLDDALKNADGLCILTEWGEFKNLPLDKIHAQMNGEKPLFADYRNLYKPSDLCNFYAVTLGRRDS